MGVGESAPHPGRLYLRERPGTHCTGGWVGPRVGLDRCGKFRPPRGFPDREVPRGFQEVKVPRLRDNGLGWW